MKTRSILVAGWIAVGLAGSAHGQFVPGHVFVAQGAGKLCNLQEKFGGDRIWEINPETGEATLFVEIPEEMCGFLTGLAFSPDGTRLRASSWLRSEILEFDSEGNMTIALDVSDGIACPWGLNNLAYDAAGNFYVLNQCTRDILRFPADGAPPTVFADADDGIGAGGAIAFAADGDLYFTTGLNGISLLRRITPEGNAFPFDSFGSIFLAEAVTGDGKGHVYVGRNTGEVFRYNAGDPGSKELLAVFDLGGRHSMAMSPDQTQIYLHSGQRILGVDVADGTVITLSNFADGSFSATAGIAVVPVPSPIPTLSGWALMVMTLLVLATGTVVLIRRRLDLAPEGRSHGRPQERESPGVRVLAC